MTNEELTIKVTEHDGEIDRCKGRIKALEAGQTALNKLATSVAVLAEQSKTMNDKMDKLSGDVEEIKSKPAKRWELIIGEVAKAIAAALIGLVIGYFVK